jgi:uncharacterized protein (TIGR02145 family)
MKAKCLSIFLVLLYEFALGQVPGTPIFNNGMSPKVYTYSVNFTNQSSVKVTGLILTNGKPLTRSGIIWGTGPTLTIESATSSVTFSTLAGTPSETITGLVVGQLYKIALFTTTSSGITTIGNIIEYLNGTVVSPKTGRTWMSFNLGATRFPATGQTDALNYGDLYQWGRGNDGHQSLKGTLQAAQLYTGTLPVAYNDPLMTTIGSRFIATAGLDWLSTNYDGLWQGVNGINNPCPSGFRVPSRLEWNAESSAFSGGVGAAFNSFLKLTPGGRRVNSATAPLEYFNSEGYYWSSTVFGVTDLSRSSNSYHLGLYGRSGTAFTPRVNEKNFSNRSMGLSVRCIKDEDSYRSSHSSSDVTVINGLAKISAYDCPPLGYTLTSGEITNEDPKFIYHFITANVTTPGNYNLTAYNRTTDVIFSGTGTLSGTGSQTIRLTASRTVKPNILGNFRYYLQNVSPACDFIVPVNHESTNGTAIIDWSAWNVNNGTTSPGYTENIRSLAYGVEASTYSPPFKAIFTVKVDKVGTYNFDAQSMNQSQPLRLVGSGTFTTTGLQNITLLFYGVPQVSGAHYFNITTWGQSPYIFTHVKNVASQ